jgi:hypothetical protein
MSTELTPAVEAAAKAIHLYMVVEGETDADVPFEDFAAEAEAAVNAAEPHLFVAAYDEAVQALGHLASFSRLDNAPEGYIRGIEEARGLISRQADALNDHMDEEGE